MLLCLPKPWQGLSWKITCYLTTILGDPGAVSRVGRKGGTKVFKYGRKSPWVPTLTKLFPKIQADAGSWLDTKMLCIIVPNRQTVSPEFFSWVRTRRPIVLPHLPGSFTKLVWARETFIFYFPNQKRRNYRRVDKMFGMLSAGASSICPENILFLTHHNVS